MNILSSSQNLSTEGWFLNLSAHFMDLSANLLDWNEGGFDNFQAPQGGLHQ